MNLKTRYVVKGIGKEQTIQSVITIATNEQGKITKVEDKWDGKLPEGSISQVSLIQLFSPSWWAFYAYAWCFWLWSLVWETRVWNVRAALSLGAVGCWHDEFCVGGSSCADICRRLSVVLMPSACQR